MQADNCYVTWYIQTNNKEKQKRFYDEFIKCLCDRLYLDFNYDEILLLKLEEKRISKNDLVVEMKNLGLYKSCNTIIKGMQLLKEKAREILTLPRNKRKEELVEFAKRHSTYNVFLNTIFCIYSLLF